VPVGRRKKKITHSLIRAGNADIRMPAAGFSHPAVAPGKNKSV